MQTLDFEEWYESQFDEVGNSHNTTMRFLDIYDRLPKCTRQGPWIVGGTIRRLLAGEKLTTDIDVMFKNEAQYEDYCAWLREAGAQIVDESPRQSTYQYEGWEIQPIKASFSNTLRQTLEKFDFTICQFGFDGENLIWGDHSMEHLKEKRLEFIGTQDHVSTMRRAFKYANQGFFMDHKSIGKFLKDVTNKTSQVVEASQFWEAEARYASGEFRGSITARPSSYSV
jgi:hypothetical protein